ncbi:hypothetical protein JXB02_01585 [Candidatus Woesearchaeota archaeon]|nr:hypothetical protein [Candidatus Woesearchaeota archaeon]
MDRILASARRAGRQFGRLLVPTALTVLAIALLLTIIPRDRLVSLFWGEPFADALIGSALGSVLAGNPVTSYVIGGEMLGKGIGIIAVTSFMLAWVTVGIITLPAEAVALGRRFALMRNAGAFLLSLAGGILIGLLGGIL